MLTKNEQEARNVLGFPREFAQKMSSLFGIASGRIRGPASTPGYRRTYDIYNKTAPNHPFYTERKLQKCSYCNEYWLTTDEWMAVHDDNCSKRKATLYSGVMQLGNDGMIKHELLPEIKVNDEHIRKLAAEESRKMFDSMSKFMLKPQLINDWSDVDETLEKFGQIIMMHSPHGMLIYMYTGKSTIDQGWPVNWSLISDNRKKCSCCGQVLPKQIEVDSAGNILSD